MSSYIEYVSKNKQWIFSGVGVAILAAFLTWCFRFLRRWSRRKLSDREREILFECAQEGELYILKDDAFGSRVRAGKKDFLEQTDPAVQERYLEAFQLLSQRGFIRHEDGDFYRLTSRGFERARQIAKEKSH
jgi:uncharacterized protein YjhX (UPF0386 family)